MKSSFQPINIRKARLAGSMFLILVFVAGFCDHVMASPQNEEVKTRLRMEYFNESGNKKLVCTLLARIDKRYKPLENVTIRYYAAADTLQESLGSALTDAQGKSTFNLNTAPELESGNSLTYVAEFAGQDNFLSARTEKEVKEVVMSVEFSKKDDQKNVILNVFEIGDEGTLIPVDGVSVTYYVPRTFSLLEFEDGQVSEGTSTIEFPTDIPGDTIGFITIVAKISDHDDYGTVSASNGINWGKVVPAEEIVKRGLGDTNAPLWMVYTLIVLLSLVWFHYLYAIFTIYRIKKEGQKIDLPDGKAG